jgi:hypothetical protein
MSEPKSRRITVNIDEIKSDMETYPELSGEVTEEVWATMSDAQKLIALAKMKLAQVKNRSENKENG